MYIEPLVIVWAEPISDLFPLQGFPNGVGYRRGGRTCSDLQSPFLILYTFGSYEQGNAPIEWIVLDRQEDRVLLSKYALDARSFHEVENRDVTWADCTLRNWLNRDFFNGAFSDEERSQIAQETNTTANAPDAQDCVFLLSLDELNAYFPDEDSRITEATEYTVAQGGRVSRETGVLVAAQQCDAG